MAKDIQYVTPARPGIAIAIGLCILTTLIHSCASPDGVKTEENVEPFYHIHVSRDNSSEDYYGTNAIWRPGIGHMELGPEDHYEDSAAIASLWLSLQVDSIDFETLTPIGSYTPEFSFYSILYPWMDLGEQEANWYNTTGVCSGTYVGFSDITIGFDKRGLSFIRGTICISMERAIINSADVPEFIDVSAEFTATEY